MITSFADPEVEQGGWIRDIVDVEITVPPTETHSFYILSFYGTGTGMNAILESLVALDYLTTGAITSGSYQYYVQTQIPTNAPLGTYSCATIIADGFDGSTIFGIYDTKIDLNVLTIVPGLTASIVSTSFMRFVYV